MSKISLKSSSKQHSLQHINLPISGRRSNHLLDTIPREKWPKKDSKPFSFCCSLDHFDPFSRYNQRKPPYKSSLTAITSVHECPVVKMQMKFSMSQLSREKKKLIKTKTLNEEEQQLKNDRLNYSQINRNNRFIRQYLEDQIALAKDIFWAEKQKIYNEKSKKAIKIAKEKNKKRLLKLEIGPRWYQDFSPDQMKNLMKLENVMLTDYEETKTDGTQMTLIAIGVISTFFKLKPSTIRELHKSCNLNSVDFLREIYKILTGNDFCEEGYKKIYDCNERIILSAIAFLTLPETMKELHKRLPVVTMPRLPPKRPPSPPEASQKSWLGKKDPYYIIAGVSTEDSHYPVTYEIAGVANVTPSNSDERFFAVLKLDQPKKVFPSGRENLSINWQEWLQNADESYRQLEEQTDELIKSVQEIMKSAFPGPVCDSCCPCRQFKKFEQKLQQSKTLNDITQDEKKNIHTDTDPMVMQSLELNPTELSINEIGLEDKIKTNMYQPIKNVPPCSCPIQQMAEDIIPSIEYIPWMKEELCPGKKYRPNKPGAYSCKMYPGNKFCKYNPFIKEIMKMKEQKIEKHKEEKEKEMKEKTEIVEITNKENQFSKKDIIEKKENKFVSNPDYPAYNNPWNISRTNDRQNDISSNELKKIKNDALDKNNNEEISLKSSNNFQKQMDRERKEIKDIHNTKKESISKEITIDKKNTKLSNTTSKMGKNQKPESLLSNKPIRQFNKINNLTKHSFVQKNRKKNVVDEIEKMENRKREIARLKNMFKFTGILDGIQPAVLPEKLASNQHNPKENTEIDSSVVNERNIKYSISSVAEDISMSPPQKIIDDPKMSTPFQTPSSSKKDILPIAGLHHHWSPMNIPSGPLQREDTALKEEMKRRKKAKDEAFKLIYGGKNEQDTYLTTRNDQEIFDKQKLMKKVGKRKDNTKESHISIKKETSKEIIRSLNKKISNKIGHQRDVSRKEITDKMIHENKYSEEIVDEIDNQQNVSHKQEKAEGKINDRSRWMNDDKKYKNNNSDLIEIMKIELKKMAAEDYTFAKLPKCYLMPQLQNWIMCREGVVFSETDKKNLMRATCSMWNLIDTNMRAEIKTPSLHMTKHQLSKLTFDQAERLKKKIEKIKAIFHSEVRKKRVLYARMMWNTMEYEKFPSASFKRTFFTYMASKEADKHVYKPWLPSEVRKRDPEFCC